MHRKSPEENCIGEEELRGGKAQKGLAMVGNSHEEQGQGSEWQPLSGGEALNGRAWQGKSIDYIATEKHWLRGNGTAQNRRAEEQLRHAKDWLSTAKECFDRRRHSKVMRRQLRHGSETTRNGKA